MSEKECLSELLVESAIRVLLRVVLVFEPLAPTAITLLINQQLHRFKETGPIGECKTKTRPLDRFHYRIEINLDVTSMQAIRISVAGFRAS